MINRERMMQGSGAPPCGLDDRNDSGTVRITAHFWVGDWLYEVDYDKVGRADDRMRLVRVQGSERRCECPGRDDAEQSRRDRGVPHAAAPMSPVGR
jgi:hypothetical protein